MINGGVRKKTKKKKVWQKKIIISVSFISKLPVKQRPAVRKRDGRWKEVGWRSERRCLQTRWRCPEGRIGVEMSRYR